VCTYGDGAHVLISQEKWDRAKAQLAEVREMLERDANNMCRQRLEEVRGFLVYITRTYIGLAPYLIGLHMTIDGWRAGRDLEGWRTQKVMVKSGKEDGWTNVGVEPTQPITVAAVPRLSDDIDAFRKNYAEGKNLRSKFASAYYGFGDASKSGFGATLQFGDDIEYEYGQWSWESEESSNWRDLNNLVEFAEGKVCSKDLEGCELFIFTDNMTTEAAFWKGSSQSRKLFELVLRLRKLEMEHDMIIHVVHISGRRMIEQGSGGLSRADHSEGVMQGNPMVDYVPLHLEPMEREPRLKPWLDSVTKGFEPVFLTPEGWFNEGQG
jgi:hypothetical protein